MRTTRRKSLLTVNRPARGYGIQHCRPVDNERWWRTEHEHLEQEDAKPDAVERQGPCLPAALVRPVCKHARTSAARERPNRVDRARTEDKQEPVLVDEVGEAKVERREREDERDDDRVRHPHRPDQQGLHECPVSSCSCGASGGDGLT